MERPKFHCPGYLLNASRQDGIGGPAPLAKVSLGEEASSPSEDQGIRLAPAMTTPDDEVLAAAHGPRLSLGMSIVR